MSHDGPSSGHGRHGKWSDPGVPHKGWTCVGTEDLEEPSLTCEMCESAEVRYVHHMEHPSYSGTLSVGCICAEHMEEDYAAPRAREADLRKVARRRGPWGRKVWKSSAKGNPYLNTEGFNLTIFRKDDGWGFRIASRTTDTHAFSKRVYRSEEEAKLATLYALLWAKKNWRGQP